MSDDSVDLRSSVSRSFFAEIDEDEIRNDHCDPLRTLMRAVLLKAVEDFQKGGILKRDAIRYFFGEMNPDGEHVFSFSNVCEALKLNPQIVRDRLSMLSRKIRLHRRVA